MFDSIPENYYYTYSLQELIEEAKKYIIGQEELVEQVSICIYKHLIKIAANKYGFQINYPTNFLIRGTTGSGKTHSIKTIAKLIGLPIIEINGKGISQEGWEGSSLKKYITESLDPIDKNWKNTIIFIDEFDKIITPLASRSSDNYNAALQSSILKYIEGINVRFERPAIRTSLGFTAQSYEIFTGDLCFIFAGAFNGLFPEVNNIGFNSLEEQKETITNALINFGMLPEIAGRISSYVESKSFTKSMYLKLMESDNFIANKWIQILKTMGYLTKYSMIKEKLASQAVEVDLGVRGLIQCIDKEINKCLLDNKINISVDKFLKL